MQTDADLCIHEALNTPDQLQKFYNQPARLALAVNTDFHTSAQAFGKVMSIVKPRHAVAYHFFNEEGTRYQIYQAIRYAGPLSMVPGKLAALTGKNNPYPDGKIGVIEEGAYADILLVDGNPLQDISVVGGNPKLFDAQDRKAGEVKTMRLIMKDGKIYKNTLPPAQPSRPNRR